MLNNLSNQNRCDENTIAGLQSLSMAELQKELVETKDKLRIVTSKFVNVRKERDQLKQENKELQEEVL